MARKSLITPEAILSYPRLFEPQMVERKDNGQTVQKPEWSCALIFPAGTNLDALKQEAIAVAKERFGEKAVDMFKRNQLKWPFRSGAEKDGYADDSTFTNVRTARKPGVVSRVPDPKNGGKPMHISDPDEVYAGCFVRAEVVCIAYDRDGGKGVTFRLNNIQKLRDGERLDSRRDAADVFEADENAVADLSDLSPEDGDEEEMETQEAAPAKKSSKGKAKAEQANVPDDLKDLVG